jgi:phage shock protein C
MYCNYCGKVIQEDAAVCAYCGKRVAVVIARKRLVRPRQNRKIAGVCAGLAEYFDLDVTLVRLVWLILLILPPSAILPYVIAWIVMPDEPEIVRVPATVQHAGQTT